jgi:hypothetical protein
VNDAKTRDDPEDAIPGEYFHAGEVCRTANSLLVIEDPMPPYPSAPPALDRDSSILIAVIDHAMQIISTVASGTRIRIQDLPFAVGYPGTKFSRI